MEVTLNGKTTKLEEGASIRALLETIGLGGELVAVEVNRAIVKRKEHASHQLHAGDVVEVVHFVGGG